MQMIDENEFNNNQENKQDVKHLQKNDKIMKRYQLHQQNQQQQQNEVKFLSLQERQDKSLMVYQNWKSSLFTIKNNKKCKQQLQQYYQDYHIQQNLNKKDNSNRLYNFCYQQLSYLDEQDDYQYPFHYYNSKINSNNIKNIPQYAFFKPITANNNLNLNPQKMLSDSLLNQNNIQNKSKYNNSHQLLTLIQQQQKQNSWYLPNTHQNYKFSYFNLNSNHNHYYQTQKQNYQQNLQKNKKNKVVPQQSINKKQPHELINYQYQAEPYMGAFLSIQSQLNCFDIKLKVPSYKEAPAFSNLLSFLTQQQQKNKFISSQINDIQSAQSQIIIPLQNNAYLQQLQLKNNLKTQIVQNQIGGIISRIKNQQNNLAQSNFAIFDFQSLLVQPQRQKKCYNLWDQNFPLTWSKCFQFQISNSDKILKEFEKKFDLMSQDTIVKSDKQFLEDIAKMLQGIQNNCFTLDYNRMQWSVQVDAFKLQHSMRNSLPTSLKRILTIANCKSRLQSAIDYIQKNQLRRLYNQFAVQIKRFIVIFEEIVLQKIQNQSCLTEFVTQVQQCQGQLKLIYGLLIDQKIFLQQKRSFFDFNHLFLNSQFVIFSKVLKLSKAEDNMNQLQHNSFSQILSNILVAIFRPIAFSLSQVVFQESYQMKNKDQHYLQFYLQNAKNLSILIGRKIKVIKQQSNQLYIICKKKLDMKIVKNIEELKEYELQWSRLFYDKRKAINEIKQKTRQERKLKKQKQYEKRVKEIYQIKKKMLESIQNQKQQKAQKFLKSFQEAKRMKQQIQKKEQQRKLMALIEKEKQKGYLLANQYKQKKRLQQMRQKLINQAQKLNIQIKGVSSNLLKNLKQQQQTKEKNIIELQILSSDNIMIQIVPEKYDRVQSLNQQFQNKNKSHLIKDGQNLSLPSKQLETIKSRMSNKSLKHKHLKIKRQKSNSSSQQSQSQQQNNSQSQQSRDYFLKQQQKYIQNKIQQQQKVNTVTVLDICIDKIIEQQVQITHMAMGYLIYEKYQLFGLLDYMKKIFMAGKGDLIQDFLNISVNNTDSVINLKYFKECLLFDDAQEMIRGLNPQFYCMRSNNTSFNNIDTINFQGQVRLFYDQLEFYIGFQFKNLPSPLQAYFSYIHLGKYMEIFSFILRLRHCSNLISQAWKQLNSYKHDVLKNNIVNELRILNKLFATRYIVQSFINILQNYLYFRVIEKEQKNLRSKLNEQQINELSVLHQKMLDNIIRNGFISNPHNDVSKKMREIFGRIRQFKNIVDMFCVDDIPSYMRQQIQAKVDAMTNIFKKNQQWFQNLFFFS